MTYGACDGMPYRLVLVPTFYGFWFSEVKHD